MRCAFDAFIFGDGDAKLTADDWRPQPAEIAAHTRTMLRRGQVIREAALEGLRKIEDTLRSDFRMSDKELGPIRELIAELDSFKDPSASTI